MNLFRHLVGLLGKGISPTQGLYLHRTTQDRKMWTHVHDPSRIWTCDPSVWVVEDSMCLRPHGHKILNKNSSNGIMTLQVNLHGLMNTKRNKI